MNYKIITDSGSDFSEDFAEKYDVEVVRMPVQCENEDGSITAIDFDNIPKFYEMLRAKAKITTSCVSFEIYIETFEKYLRDGIDVLCIAFSSALSGNFQTGSLAAEELRSKYPERKIFVVDSLGAALGEGLLVTCAAEKRDSGLSIEELNDWLVENRLKVCHWFTVDDLFFLKRGGRIPASTAIVGSILSIKPIMHMDDEGRLVPVSKSRGRHASLAELVNRMEESVFPDAKQQKIYISHGDCPEDAKIVANLIRERLGVQDITLECLNPVVSAHSGPGTVALFFMGRQR